MTNQPKSPTAAQARASAEAEKLPCFLRSETYCVSNGSQHDKDCPAYYRPAVAAALLAAERRGREQEQEEIAAFAEQRAAGQYGAWKRAYQCIAKTVRQQQHRAIRERGKSDE